MNNFASLVQPLPPGAGSSTACATVPKVDLIAPSLSHSSSVVIGLGLFEESVAEGRTIAPGVYTKLRSLYEYNPPPAQGTGTGTARNACFLDGCQNGFRALRYCSLAAIRLRTLLSCDANAADAGERVLACVEATLEEAHALGLPDEMHISSCKVVLSGDGGAAKWFIESLQNEEASLLVFDEKILAMDSSSLPVFPPDPVQATKKTRTENVEIVQPQPPLIPVRQVRPLFPNGLPGITNLSSSIEQQTDDAIFKPFTKFFIELDEAIKALQERVVEVTNLKSQIKETEWYQHLEQWRAYEYRESRLLSEQSQQQLTPATDAEIQRCRQEKEVHRQYIARKPPYLVANETMLTTKIQDLGHFVSNLCTNIFKPKYITVKKAITVWKKAQQVADFVAESVKGRQELLDALDIITPFCAALIDNLLQLNNDISKFVRDYFKCQHLGCIDYVQSYTRTDTSLQCAQVKCDCLSQKEIDLLKTMTSFNALARNWFFELLEMSMVVECQPVPATKEKFNSTEVSSDSEKSKKEKIPAASKHRITDTREQEVGEAEEPNKPAPPRLLDVRSVFTKTAALTARVRWLVSLSFWEHKLAEWNSLQPDQQFVIPVFARLLRIRQITKGPNGEDLKMHVMRFDSPPDDGSEKPEGKKQNNPTLTKQSDGVVLSSSPFRQYYKTNSPFKQKIEQSMSDNNYVVIHLAIFDKVDISDHKETKENNVADIRHFFRFDCDIVLSWDNLIEEVVQPRKFTFKVYSNPVMIVTNTIRFRAAHSTAFWDSHFGTWVPHNTVLSESVIQGANRAAATETPQFQMSSEVTWKEFLDGLDLWFLCKSGRGLFDPYPYEHPNVGDYLISRHYNTLKKDNKGKLTLAGLFAEYQKKENKVTFQEACREFRFKEEIHELDLDGDEEQQQKKKPAEFTFFEWSDAILEFVVTNKYHREIWISGDLHGFMTKSDAFEMLKRPGMNLLNFIIRFSQTSLAAVAISYSYGADSGVFHLENAGPWNEKHLNHLSLRKRIENPKHGLRYIYPNRPITNMTWSKFPEEQNAYLKELKNYSDCQEQCFLENSLCDIYTEYKVIKLTQEPIVNNDNTRKCKHNNKSRFVSAASYNSSSLQSLPALANSLSSQEDATIIAPIAQNDCRTQISSSSSIAYNQPQLQFQAQLPTQQRVMHPGLSANETAPFALLSSVDTLNTSTSDFAATTNSAYFYPERNIGGVNHFGALTPPQMRLQPQSAYPYTGAELEGMNGTSASGSPTGPGASTVNAAPFTTQRW